MITIKEIADMLGLSTTTVSNVIHGKTKEVSEATVERVRQVLKEYDYVPNINARNLASNQSKIIGVTILNSRKGYVNYLKDAFISELLGSIERELKEKGYYLMMCFSTDTRELIQRVSAWNADGLILFGIVAEDYQKIQKQFKKPQVYIDSYPGDFYFNGVNIGLEDRRGGYLAGRYLLSHGHRRIGFVADNFKGGDYERYCGFAEAMSEAGVTVRDSDFIEVEPDEEALAACYESLYQRLHEFTAFFCASDFYALCLMNFLTDRDVKVPEDISIVGFDDNVYSRMARPAITTIHQDATQKGVLAVEQLMKMIESGEQSRDQVVLPVELVERDTVGQIPVTELTPPRI